MVTKESLAALLNRNGLSHTIDTQPSEGEYDETCTITLPESIDTLKAEGAEEEEALDWLHKNIVVPELKKPSIEFRYSLRK